MSANYTPNASAPSDGIAPHEGQDPGDSVSRTQKTRHHKAAKKSKGHSANFTKPGGNVAGQRKVQTARGPLKPTQKPQHGRSGVSLESLNAEAKATKVVAMSSESSSVTQTLSQLDAASSSQERYSDTAESNGPSRPEDSSIASPSPTVSAIVAQPIDNLLEMIRPQRQALLTGPQISLRIGRECVTGIYKRAAMAVSPILQQHFSDHPESLEYHFPKSKVQPSAVSFLLVEWMHETCNEFEAYAVPAQKSFEEDVAVLRAAHLLHMEKYCAHTLAEYVNYLKTYVPSYEEIAIIEKHFPPDKLWRVMVKSLRYQRFKKCIPDPEDFEKFLEEHPRLKNAMKASDEVFARKAKEHADLREDRYRQRQEKHEAERHEGEAHGNLTATALKKKILDLVS